MTQVIFDLRDYAPIGTQQVKATISDKAAIIREYDGAVVFRNVRSRAYDFDPITVEFEPTQRGQGYGIYINTSNGDMLDGMYAIPAPNIVGGVEVPVSFTELKMLDPKTLDTHTTLEVWNVVQRTLVNAQQESGDLILIRDDGTRVNVGRVKGEDGLDGVDGAPGTPGRDGYDGRDGANGVDGLPGEPGIVDDASLADQINNGIQTQIALDSSYVKTYGAIGSDSIAVQTAVNAAQLTGGEVFLNGNYVFDATVSVGSNVLIRGDNATIHISGNRPAFLVGVGAVSTRFKGIKFTGTLPGDDIAVIQNQVAIKAFGLWDNMVDGLEVTDCKFERVQGTAIQMQHVKNFRIQNNEIFKHGYAAIGGSSVKFGLIEGNNIEGTHLFPSYVSNTYGIYVSTLEADGDVGTLENPRSSDVMIRNNIVRKQRWSCLDTHVGQRISFIGNHIDDSPASAINAVYISMTPGHPDAQLAPEDIIIEGNIITYPTVQESDMSMTMGILLRGSVSGDSPTTRSRATGVIRGNVIRRYGRQDTSTSGAIFVGGGRGVIVDGNTMHECRSIGIHVNDSLDTIVTANTFVDLWRSSGAATAVYVSRTTLEPTIGLTVMGNRFVRGNLSEANGLPVGGVVNTHAIAGTTGPEISVLAGNNEWLSASFSSGHTNYQVATQSSKRVSGVGIPVSGMWNNGDQIINSAPSTGGHIGWVCVAGGSPGTWRGYGLISNA